MRILTVGAVAGHRMEGESAFHAVSMSFTAI
jgi:hypothetical protein